MENKERAKTEKVPFWKKVRAYEEMKKAEADFEKVRVREMMRKGLELFEESAGVFEGGELREYLMSEGVDEWFATELVMRRDLELIGRALRQEPIVKRFFEEV